MEFFFYFLRIFVLKMPFPPPLEDAEILSLQTHAIDWAYANGLVVKSSDGRTVHAPFALFPSPFPRKLYIQAQQIQPIINHLMHALSQDTNLITETMEELSLSDDFIHQCFKIYKTVQEEGTSQPVVLGVHRSDYLVHEGSVIQQVEINTIAASFAGLSTITSQLHRYLSKRSNLYNHEDLPKSDIKPSSLPENKAVHGIAKGLATAWSLYGIHEAVAAIIVQPGENNVYDQRMLEYILFQE